jgi:hypothetical protein
VEVQMLRQILPPRVQDGRDAERAAEVAWVAAEGEQRVGRRAEEERVEHAGIALGERVEGMREGEDDVEGGDRVIVTGGYAPRTRPTWAVPLGVRSRVADSQVAWRLERGSPYTLTPIVNDWLVYMVTDSGILSAYDVGTGERVYQERLGLVTGFSASPVLADGRVYFASEDGDVFVVRAGRTFELLATNRVGQIVMATPAIAGDQLVVRGVRELIAFSASARPSDLTPGSMD